MKLDPLAPVVRHLVAPAWAAWEHSPYLKHYRRLLQTQFDAPEVIRQRQDDAVKRIVKTAYCRSPFWRDKLEAAGVRPEDVRTCEDLATIPPLGKDELRAHVERMVAQPLNPAGLIEHKTSGSTGVSVRVYLDENARQAKRGCTLRSDEWSGWRLGERVAKVWGNPEYVKRGWRGRLRNALLDRARYLDTLRMSRDQILAFAESLRRTPPSLLFGHAHSLYLFATVAREHGPVGFRPRGIIATAMVLHDWERRAIEETFGCEVTDRYGCEEVGLIASECEQHNGLHINEDGILVEVVDDDDRPVPAGQLGRLLITDLHNQAMPLIRYRVGDSATLSDRRCPCGRGLNLIESLAGREADFVVTPSGDLISGISLTENFAVLIPGLVQFQIIQEELRRFTFVMVKGPGFDEGAEVRIGELVAERLGDDVEYECRYMDRIPLEPSGKFRFCISRISGGASGSAPSGPGG